MKRFVEGADRGQSTLLPECLDDFIDEINPVRAIDAFVDTLVRNDANVTVRRSKGREIAAACGQLRGKTERKLPQRRVDSAVRTEAADVERDVVDHERR